MDVILYERDEGNRLCFGNFRVVPIAPHDTVDLPLPRKEEHYHYAFVEDGSRCFPVIFKESMTQYVQIPPCGGPRSIWGAGRKIHPQDEQRQPASPSVFVAK